MTLLQRLVSWWQARKRGERRIAPTGYRGRVYARSDDQAGGVVAAKGKPKATIRARVYRAATDTWEDQGVISRPEKE